MTTLTGKTPKNTYKDLLQVSNSNNGVDGTLRNVSDGEATSTPLQLASDAVNIQSGFQLGGAAVTASAADLNATSSLSSTYQPLDSVLTNTTASFTTAQETKLAGIEALADVTDTANVTAAGALMDSELTDEAAVKAIDQGLATSDDPTFTNTTYSAIDKILNSSANIVDVFIYDTSKDSDGGAWRDRTDSDFPALAAIVAETDAVTIYDATDADAGQFAALSYSGKTINGLTARDGQIWVAAESGVFVENYAADELSEGTETYTTSTTPAIVNNACNDVAITVLPSAPILESTGLPAPTIDMFTDGGTSRIWWADSADEYVADLVDTAADDHVSGGITDDGYSFAVNSTSADVHGYSPVTASADSTTPDETYDAASTPALLEAVASTTVLTPIKRALAVGQSGGLTLIYREPGKPANALSAYVTTEYNTGLMGPDPKLATLADTDATDLVATTVVDQDMSSSTGWTLHSGWSITGGELVASSTLADTTATYSFSTVEGETYIAQADCLTITGGAFGLYYRQSGVGFVNFTDFVAGETATLTFIAQGSTSTIRFYSFGTSSGTFDNLTVKLATPNRVGQNPSTASADTVDPGLIVNGTITATAVATGAELVAYSGFNASNYFEQPYNADLDFGTGDFCVKGWFKDTETATDFFVDRSSLSGRSFSVLGIGSDFRFSPGSVNLVGGGNRDDGEWHQVVGVRSNGTAYLYVDGRLITSAASTDDLDDPDAVVTVGVRYDTSNAASLMSVSLLSISATAPTPAQIRAMYESEKHMFRENAACTIGGTSDAVRKVRYDADSDQLAAATGDGTSIFRGLERISYIDSTADTTLTSDDHNAVAISRHGYLINSAAEAVIDFDAIGVRDQLARGQAGKKIVTDADGLLHFTGYTDDATATDIGKIQVGEGEHVEVIATIAAREIADSTGERAAYKIGALFYRDTGGNVTIQGSVQSLMTAIESTGTMAATLAADTTAQTIDINVTGVAATDLEWRAKVEVNRIGETQHVAG